MEIKSVRITEIHWSINWNASQQANDRLKEMLGPTSKYFAALKVGNATYNWVVDTVAEWRPMGAAPDSVKTRILEKTEEVRQEVFSKLGSDDNLAGKICQVPNYEEYIFYRDDPNGIDVVITGWGFHNFKKAGPFVATWPPKPVMHTTTIAFTVDGQRQPGRAFSIVTPKMRKPFTTDEQGLQAYKEYAGVNITVIDDITQRQFTFTTADKDCTLEFDVTDHTAPPEPEPEPEPQPIDDDDATIIEEPTPVVTATVTVLDAQGQPMKGASCRLQQGEQTHEGVLDDQGVLAFTKSNFSLEQPLQAHISPVGGQPSDVQFTLQETENDYVLQQNAPRQGSRLREIIMFLLLLASLLLLLIFVFQPGIEELTKVINKNIF